MSASSFYQLLELALTRSSAAPAQAAAAFASFHHKTNHAPLLQSPFTGGQFFR
jgi:hypothetical protein